MTVPARPLRWQPDGTAPRFPSIPLRNLHSGASLVCSPEKNPDSLDIPLPELCRRYVRNFKDLSALDPATFGNKRLPLKAFTDEEAREMIFKKLLDSEIDHTIHLDSAGKADWSSVIAFFAASFTEYKS